LALPLPAFLVDSGTVTLQDVTLLTLLLDESLSHTLTSSGGQRRVPSNEFDRSLSLQRQCTQSPV